MVDLKDIQEYVNQVVREFHPEKVILFGSYAYGEPTEVSDVDLMIVMPYEGHPVRKALEIETRLQPNFYPDIKVRSAGEIRQRLAWHDFFLMEVMKKGKVLYDTNNS